MSRQRLFAVHKFSTDLVLLPLCFFNISLFIFKIQFTLNIWSQLVCSDSRFYCYSSLLSRVLHFALYVTRTNGKEIWFQMAKMWQLFAKLTSVPIHIKQETELDAKYPLTLIIDLYLQRQNRWLGEGNFSILLAEDLKFHRQPPSNWSDIESKARAAHLSLNLITARLISAMH